MSLPLHASSKCLQQWLLLVSIQRPLGHVRDIMFLTSLLCQSLFRLQTPDHIPQRACITHHVQPPQEHQLCRERDDDGFDGVQQQRIPPVLELRLGI